MTNAFVRRALTLALASSLTAVGTFAGAQENGTEQQVPAQAPTQSPAADGGAEGDAPTPAQRQVPDPATPSVPEASPPVKEDAPAPGDPSAPQEPSAQAPGPDAEAVVPALPAPPIAGGEAQNDLSSSQQTSAPTRQGPASVADLAEGLLDAVVNISTSQSVERPGRGIPPLEAPEGSPLQEFFDELLQDRDGIGERRAESLGSGFVIDPSGIVVTNNHVITDADTVTVNFADGRQLDAEVLGTDPKTDLAVLKVEPEEPLTAVQFGDSDTVRIGDWVMAIGNPFGLGGSVSVGIVSARGRNINAGPYDNFIQTDAAINRGNSGGPLFDMDGNVVGINTAIISPTGGSIGIGFSIPSKLAVNVIDQLREFGETRRGWIGIRLQAVTDDIAAGLGIGETRGAVVAGIIPGGPSDNGKLKVGDVITEFDGREIETSRDLPRIVAETPVGKTVTIGILRKPDRNTDVQPLDVEVTLGRLEDGERLLAEAESGGGDEPAAANENGGEQGRIETLGMELVDLDDAGREQFDLGAEAVGALVSSVAPNSAAAEKGIEAGATIREVAQEEVSSARDVADKIAELREAGRRNALLLIAAPNGDLRFVVVPIE